MWRTRWSEGHPGDSRQRCFRFRENNGDQSPWKILVSTVWTTFPSFSSRNSWKSALSLDGKISKVAVVEDIRGYASYPADEKAGDAPGGRNFLEDSRRIIKDLQKEDYPMEILFLESSDAVLMRRYSETRRQHPLSVGGSIREGIRLERERLQGIRDMATRVIDTTDFNVHQLKDEIQRYAQEGLMPRQMAVTLLSFGYSFGIPYEADLLFDVRFLPNPYFVEELKRLNGDDPKVADYVLQWDEAKEFLRRVQEFIQFLLPLYEREGKTQLTIAVGCTGGRHRSMVIVNRLARISGTS